MRFFPQAFRELALDVQRNKGDSRKCFDRYARAILQRVLNAKKKKQELILTSQTK